MAGMSVGGPYGRAEKGSRRQVQTYVNWRTSELNEAIVAELPGLEGSTIEWVSPIEADAFREYRAAKFLAALDLSEHAVALSEFWPARGPVWDALAKVASPGGDRPGAILVEGKSYPEEMYGGRSRAKDPRSIEQMRRAIEWTQTQLDLEPDASAWSGELYQHANRLAHLMWLRSRGVRATLVHLLFFDDHEHRATTRAEWAHAARDAARRLGLEKRVPGEGYVFLPAVPMATPSSRTPDAVDVLRALRRRATNVGGLDAPTRAGVYAFFLKPRAVLPHVDPGEAGLLYAGMSVNLAERKFRTHFATGRTGFSTLRRSVGAILKETLDLRCRPRGAGASATNYTNYCFDDVGERRLTEWMRDHLLVAVHPVDAARAVEQEVILAGRPPLNLKGWPNPHAATIRALRRRCADEARGGHPR